MIDLYQENTLTLNPELCNGCRMCTNVCPHAVFEIKEKRAVIKNGSACMECGACALNCESKALAVDSGVGCAAAMFHQSLKGAELAECGT